MNIEQKKPIQEQDRRKFFLTVARAAGLAMLM